MKAVESDSDWQLVFPDTQHPKYDEKWDGDLQKWIDAGYPVIQHMTIKAKELWDAIVENAWANGEPGIWFINKANAYSNSHYLGRLNCTNPCFEEPLPPWGVCCLGSLNLPAFINGARIDFSELEKAIPTAVRFLDDVISVTPYFHDEIEERQKSERRIGLGTMGLAEVLIRLGLRYGSDESLAVISQLYGFIAKTAYLASVELAKEKGRFPSYRKPKASVSEANTDEFLKSGFMTKMPKVNLPYESTKDDVSNVFKKLYASGCKGGTVYRDGSRKEQVLTRKDSKLAGGTLTNFPDVTANRQGCHREQTRKIQYNAPSKRASL